MARTEGIHKIILGGQSQRAVRVTTIDSDTDTCKLIHIPMELEWPGGDPIPRDRETLVIRYNERDAARYGVSGNP